MRNKVRDMFTKLWRVTKLPLRDAPELVVAKDAGGGRHYAYYDRVLYVVGYSPYLEDASDALIRGVIAHEIGHVLVDKLELRGARGIDASERQADRVAEEMLGLRIYYGSDDVQRAGQGARGRRPRPCGLR